jgi:hypothetical protein
VRTVRNPKGEHEIRFYFRPTPNPAKVALFLEDSGLTPLDTSKADSFRLSRFDGNEIMTISTTRAPIYAELEGKRAGDAISFTGRELVIGGGRLRAATPNVKSGASA